MSLAQVRARIAAACERVGRDPASVTLVAVTKGHSAEAIDRTLLRHGHRVLGENRVQEWQAKREALAERIGDDAAGGLEWHFIGNLQRNKVKYLAGVHTVHSLNSRRLADEMQKQAARRDFRLRVMVEVNVAGEASKQGVEPAEAAALVRHARALDRLRVTGLMTMAPYADDPEVSRPCFRRLRELAADLGLAELSMGMSGDFEVAVEEGATVVRVGSALFE